MEDNPKHSLQAESTPAVDGKVDEKYNNVCRLAVKHLKVWGKGDLKFFCLLRIIDFTDGWSLRHLAGQ